MSAATSMALEKAPRRGSPRYPVNVAFDVIALRSGVPENLPGRCTDLSEGGVGGMVAGELASGQQVAVELRLPNVGVPVRARALVRYHGRLRCGFEFVGLSVEQQELIRYWAYRLAPRPELVRGTRRCRSCRGKDEAGAYCSRRGSAFWAAHSGSALAIECAAGCVAAAGGRGMVAMAAVVERIGNWSKDDRGISLASFCRDHGYAGGIQGAAGVSRRGAPGGQARAGRVGCRDCAGWHRQAIAACFWRRAAGEIGRGSGAVVEV